VPPTATSPPPLKPFAVIVNVTVFGAGVPPDGGGVGAIGELLLLSLPQEIARAASTSATPAAGSIHRFALGISIASFIAPFLWLAVARRRAS
jgi:hypothetical protein